MNFLKTQSAPLALSFWILSACSSGSDEAETLRGSGDSQSPVQQTGGSNAGINIAEEPPSDWGDLPAEIEVLHSEFRSPVVTGDYLWSPNESSGKVALINADTLETHVLGAGLRPTELAAVHRPGTLAAAIVLNSGTSDASFFEVTEEGISSERVALNAGANAWAIAPGGRYAVAWTFSASDETVDPTEGLQEISIIDLDESPLSARRVGVGYRPSQIVFNDEEDTLIVVAEYGISLLDLSSTDVEWVSLAAGVGRDVSITADGEHALVRREGSDTVEILSLDESEAVLSLQLPGAVTDLDLSASGRAVAVVREASLMATFLVPELLADPGAWHSLTLPGEIIGSVELTDSGEVGVLYTTAAESSRLSVVSLKEGDGFLESKTLNTQTPVRAVTVSPDGAHAVALGRGTEGGVSGAFSILSLQEIRFPRIMGTGAPVEHVQLGNEIGVVTATSPAGLHEAHLISLSGLHVEVMSLASPPLSAGILPHLQTAFAAQVHPEGRVTFFEFAEGDARTLTGFELSSEIVQK